MIMIAIITITDFLAISSHFISFIIANKWFNFSSKITIIVVVVHT